MATTLLAVGLWAWPTKATINSLDVYISSHTSSETPIFTFDAWVQRTLSHILAVMIIPRSLDSFFSIVCFAFCFRGEVETFF